MRREEVSMATAAEVGLAIRHLALGFPSFVLPADSAGAYVDDLGDLQTEHLLEAVRRIRRVARFFPTIAEIREVAHEVAEERRAEARERRPARVAPPREEYDQNDPRIIECKRQLRLLARRTGKGMP